MEIIPDPLHALLLVLPFAITALFLNQVLWKPLLAFLDERAAVVTDAQAAAKRATHEAETGAARIEARLVATRASVSTARAEARARAHVKESEIVTESRRQADVRLTAAIKDIQQSRAAASQAMQTAATELSADIASRVLDRRVAEVSR